MATQLSETLRLLRGHPDKWLKPGDNAGLLACLILSLYGLAIAIEDENGIRFRLAQPVRLSA